MSEQIIISIISMLGTAIGAFGGIIASARVTSLRLRQLEEKVDKHNRFAERIPVIEEKIAVADHRICELEQSFRDF